MMAKRFCRLAFIAGVCWISIGPSELAAGGVLAITNIEYFFDSDPGEGIGASVAMPGTQEAELDFNPDTSGLQPGAHTLFVRAQDTSGLWSFVQARTFVIEPLLPDDGMAPDLTRVEYFIDDDPGEGNGEAIAFTAGLEATEDFTPDIAGLRDGAHTLFVRAQDEPGSWSTPAGAPFVQEVNAPGSGLPDVMSVDLIVVRGGSEIDRATVAPERVASEINEPFHTFITGASVDDELLVLVEPKDSSTVKGIALPLPEPITFLREYDRWLTDFFDESQRNAVEIVGLTVDFDDDGLSNGIEFAFGGDPTEQTPRTDFLPAIEEEGGSLRVVYRQRVNGIGTTGVNYSVDGVVYTVEVSDTLEGGSWVTGTDRVEQVGVAVDGGDGFETVRVRSKDLIGDSDRQFMRLKVFEE